MREVEETRIGSDPEAADEVAQSGADHKPSTEGFSRRDFLGVTSTALAAAALTGLTAHAQEIQDTRKAEKDHSVSDPGQENRPLLDENPDSNLPPPTDHGDIGPIWYSFDLAHKRVQDGGWTHEVNSFVLPTSKDLTGVNMRLTAGSFRELHWHTADEWAIMLYGNARVTVMNPDGTMFIDDVGKGDLWLFPAGYPHSIQGLQPDGCQFLLVFDQGDFSEDGTFLFSEMISHTPHRVLAKNFGIDKGIAAKLVKEESLYIFPADLPLSLAQDKASIGGLARGISFPVHVQMSKHAPHQETPGGEVRIVDSRNFPCVEEHRRRTGYSQARSLARIALASQCKRVAVLALRQGTHGRHRERGKSPHHGLQCQRRGLCSQGCRPLHRKHWQHRLHLFGNVQGRSVCRRLRE